jgi:hypothetical protein
VLENLRRLAGRLLFESFPGVHTQKAPQHTEKNYRTLKSNTNAPTLSAKYATYRCAISQDTETIDFDRPGDSRFCRAFEVARMGESQPTALA